MFGEQLFAKGGGLEVLILLPEVEVLLLLPGVEVLLLLWYVGEGDARHHVLGQAGGEVHLDKWGRFR